MQKLNEIHGNRGLYISKFRKIIKAGFPTFIQFLIAPIFAICDTTIVAHLLGTVPLAGLSLAWIIVQAMFGIFIFGSYLTNATVSRALGSGKVKKALSCGMDGVYLCILLGIFCFIVVFFGSESIVKIIFNPESAVLEQAAIYLRIMSFTFPFAMLILATNGILRAFDKTKFLGKVAIISSVVNVAANLFFIAVCHLGIAGSALGSALVWGCQGIVQLIPVLMLVRKHGVKKRTHIKRLFSSFKESIPMIVRSVTLWGVLTFEMAIVSQLGTYAIAANQIIDCVWVLMLTLVESIEVTMQTMIGKKLGAKDYEGAKFTLKSGLLLGFLLSAVVSTLTLISSFFITPFFTPDKNVQEYAVWGLVGCAISGFYCFYSFIMDGAYVAARDTIFQAKAVIISAIVFVPSSLFLVQFIPHKPFGFLLAWGLYDVIFQGVRLSLAHWRRSNDRWLKCFKETVAPTL